MSQVLPFDWFKIFLSILALVMIFSGFLWCITPTTFVVAYHAIAPRDIYAKTAKWRKAVLSPSGRVAGGLLFTFSCFVLYKLLISGEF